MCLCFFRSFCWWSSCVWLFYWPVWSASHCRVCCGNTMAFSWLFLKPSLYLSSSVLFSVCRPLADVFVDGHYPGSRAVHSSKWAVFVLAVHSSCHHAAVLDATGTVRHHDKSPWVDTHGSVNILLVSQMLLLLWKQTNNFLFVWWTTASEDHCGGCDVSRADPSAAGSTVWTGDRRSSQSPSRPNAPLLPLAGRSVKVEKYTTIMI